MTIQSLAFSPKFQKSQKVPMQWQMILWAYPDCHLIQWHSILIVLLFQLETMRQQRQLDDPQTRKRFRSTILAKVPTKPFKDFLDYLEENTQPPTCYSKLMHCFTCRRYRTVNAEFRTAFQTMQQDEKMSFYIKILKISESIINKKTPLAASATNLEQAAEEQRVMALVESPPGSPAQKEQVRIDYQNKRVECKNYNLHLRDYLLKKTNDNYLTLATFTPLAPNLPLLQIHSQQDLFQRLQAAAHEALLERMLRIIEGEAQSDIDSDIEENPHSERPSISDQLSSKLKASKEEICAKRESLVNYLTYRHPTQPYPKGNCKLLIPKGDIHYFFEGEYRIGSEGELIVCNETKLQEQSNVIKYIIKRLLTGTKVFSISLPVQVFGTESNLSLLLASFRFAPLLLHQAAALNALDRFKQVVKFSLTCPACYIRCDKPFNPIIGQTYQSIIDGTLFYGEQVSHHPPVSAALIKGRDFTLYGSFEAEVQFGFNSAVGNNKGWVKISFDPSDPLQKVVRFTNSPGEMGGLIFGKRKLCLIESVYYIDEENYIFCELFYGRVKLQSKVDERKDSIEGRVLQLKRSTNLSKPEQISEKDAEGCYGLLHGEWLSRVYFNDELLLDTRKQYPPAVQEYGGLLPSDYSLREDIILRHTPAIEECQAAKERLQQGQRRDRKLREGQK